MTRADDALFVRVCELFEQLDSISNAASSIPKRRLHMRTIARWFDQFHGGDVYLVFRLLIPTFDLRRVYYIKEKRLADFVVSILGLKGSKRGQRLVNWRSDNGHGRSQGDLSSVVFDTVKQAEHCLTCSLTISRVNHLLDELVACKRMSSGMNVLDTSAAETVFQSALLQCTALEAKWLVRVVLKDLLIRIEPRTFFDAFHGWMWRIYSMNSDLQSACKLVTQVIAKGYHSATKLSDEEFQVVSREFFGINIGTPIGIMACGRATGLDQVCHRMAGKTCHVEQKFDGERLQAHISKAWPERIRIFSKSNRDSTRDRYRCHEQLLRALKFLDPVSVIQDCIVEGELLVYNETKGRVESFGTVQDLQPWKSNHRGDVVSGDRHYCVLLFDLLYLNGQNLTMKPLRFRRALLETITVCEPNWVELTKIDMVAFPQDKQQLAKLFATAVVNRMEGLIIKNVESPYLPGNRSEWMKMKKDYIDGFGDTAEFAVIGVSYGRASEGHLNTLIVGVLTNKDALATATPNYTLVLTVSQGFNEEEKVLFHHRVQELLVKPGEPLEYTWTFATGYHEAVDFYLKEPVIVELLGSGFVRERGQPHYPHYTLRFPRIVKVFFNRDIHDCLSFQELQEVAQSSFVSGPAHEKKALESNLFGHQRKELARPARVVPASEDETPCKMLKRMMTISKRPLDILRSDYLFHVPRYFDDRNELTLKLEALGLVTLYHVVAVARCESKKCIIVTRSEWLAEFKTSLKEYGDTAHVLGLDRADVDALLENPGQFQMDTMFRL